jgi:hypothetical protein
VDASLRVVIPCVEGRVVLEVAFDICPAELGDQLLDGLFVFELLGVCRLLLYGAVLGVEVGDIEEVASVAAVLADSLVGSGCETPSRHTAKNSQRSCSVIRRVTPGATSMVRPNTVMEHTAATNGTASFMFDL